MRSFVRAVSLIAFSMFAGYGQTAAPAIGPELQRKSTRSTDAQEQCSELGSTDRQRIIRFARVQLKVPDDLELALTVEGFVPETCYQRVRLRHSAPRFAIDYPLIVLDNHAFLVSVLHDTRNVPGTVPMSQADQMAGSPPVRGDALAPVSVVVFTDFQCPFCARTAEVLARVDPSSVRITFRHFPLSHHSWARDAAVASACAARQGVSHFWAFHDHIFDQQSEFTPLNLQLRLMRLASTRPDFDTQAYGDCARRELAADVVQNDLELGKRQHVSGTPTVFVNGEQVSVASPDNVLKAVEAAKARSRQR